MNEAAQQATLKKAMVRLVPFLFLLYVIAYLDRVNVSFAQLQMKDNLHFSDKTYGLGAGIFFLGYFLFEVPSNLILQRVGARRWIARIMVSWGVVAMAMLFIHSRNSFYAMRFLLGMTEAGFFPGVMYYLTTWFTGAERARIVAWFMTANAAAYIVGGPVSGRLLTMNGLHGLTGWQWLFLLEGMPAVLFGFVTLAYLPDGPKQAVWLTQKQKDWLLERLRVEQEGKARQGHLTLWDALGSRRLWHLCALFFVLDVGMYGLSLFLPLLIKEFGHLSDFQVGMYSAVPYMCAAVAMVLAAAHSDKTGERRLHVAVPAFVGALGLFITGRTAHAPLLGLAAMSLAAAGMWSTLGAFWALPTSFLGGAAAAGGIAIINSVGNLGGFAGPAAVGALKEHFHTSDSGLYLLSGALVAAGLLALALPPERVPVLEIYEDAENARATKAQS